MHPDLQSTADYLYALSRTALEQGGSFAPFATGLTMAGERTHSSTDLPVDASTPGEHVAALLAVLQEQAPGLAAAGVAFDSALASPQGSRPAICLHIERREGEAVQIFAPYVRAPGGAPAFEEPLVQDAAARIFAP